MIIGQEINDGETKWKVVKFFEESSKNQIFDAIGIRKSVAFYKIGDKVKIPMQPFIIFECIESGITDTNEINFNTEEYNYSIPIGTFIEDGTAKWIILDAMDGTPVGGFRFSLYVPPGYVIANGSTVNRTDYPRLTKMVNDNNLWTESPDAYPGLFGIGDGENTMVLPDLRGKYIKCVEEEAGKVLEAGLPNISGSIVNAYGNFTSAAGVASATNSIVKGGNAEISITSGSTFNVDISSTNGYSTINLDASNNSSIYGKSETVQPPTITMLPIIRY